MQRNLEVAESLSPVRYIDCSEWASAFHPELRLFGLAPEGADEVEAWLERVRACAADLPTAIRDACGAMVAGNGPIAVHFRGLPVPDDLPPTPVDTLKPPLRSERNAEAWLALIGIALGDLFAHSEICGGHLFHSVAPEPGQEYQPTGVCSKGRLTMHTDGATHPMPPDFVLLWCHRGDADVRTAVASAEVVREHLDPNDRALLSEPRFRHRLDYEFRASLDRGFTAPAPILSESPFGPTIGFDVDFVEIPPEADEGLMGRLEDALESVAAQVILRPGELLVLDNHRCAHARDGFLARFDGTDRWLQCAYVRRFGQPVPAGVRVDGRVVSFDRTEDR